ncbi:MAG TPA: hypothetical protein VLJ42_00270 [Solirubrobacteraceae bacterium]|nr:hypothetical protein [Solirubrobacteraceae bacterium]
MQTDRDAEIVYWIGSLGAAGAEHVMRQFEMSRSMAYQRLNSLTRDGLLEHHAVLYGRSGMYCATSAGLRWRNLGRLGVCRVRPGGFEHAWQVAQAAVELQACLPDWDVMSDRRIRWFEAENNRPFASAEVGRSGERPALHRPDLALVSPEDGLVVSIEVELSVKSAARLATICRGWARARHLYGVYYLAAPEPGRAVRRAVNAAHATDSINVLNLDQVYVLAAEVRESFETGEVRIDEAAFARLGTPSPPYRELQIMADMRTQEGRSRLASAIESALRHEGSSECFGDRVMQPNCSPSKSRWI